MVMWELPLEAQEDPFRPPDAPCDVFCLHCGEEFSSSQIQWRLYGMNGSWCCPTPGCDGVGYQFDILPADVLDQDMEAMGEEPLDVSEDSPADEDVPW